MVDFWFNHFNVDARKGAVKWMIADYERTAIRPHALGKFRDLLLATAQHPAMLFYLDNWMSTKARPRRAHGSQRGRQMGLNENYAREMHGAAHAGRGRRRIRRRTSSTWRAFTGWSIDRPREYGAPVFRLAAHDQGRSVFSDTSLPAGGGEQDGVRVIEILVAAPVDGPLHRHQAGAGAS